MNNAGASPALRRAINLPGLMLYGLGTMIGAGIYVLIGRIAGHAGDWTPVVFLLAALLALPSAWSYGQLASRLPRSAGEAVYVQHAFGLPGLSTVTGLGIILTGIVSAATLSRGLLGYLQVFIALPDAVVIVGFVLLLAGVASWGVRESVALAVIITLLEIAGLGVVVILAWPDLVASVSQWQPALPPAAAWPGIATGITLAFYAFIGFEDMVNMAEEVKQPARTLPAGIMLALLIASLIYLLVAVAAISALAPAFLASSDAPFATLVEDAGYSPRWIALISLIAIINGALVQLIMASRVLFGMARQHLLPTPLGRVHPQRQTPLLATGLSALAIIGFALVLPLEPLARLTSSLMLAIFTLVNLSQLALCTRERRWRGVPIPLVGALSCVGFLLWQLR